MKKLLALVVMTVMSFALASGSQAAIVSGVQDVSSVKNTGFYNTSTGDFTFTLQTNSLVDDSTGSFASIGDQIYLPSGPLSLGNFSTFSFGNATFGNFIGNGTGSFTLNSVAGIVYGASLQLNGVFQPGATFGGLTSSTAQLTLAFSVQAANQLGISKTTITGSLTASGIAPTPIEPVNTPEPATALIWGGISLMGLVAGYRRKQLLTA